MGGNYASDNKIVNSTMLGEFVLPTCTVLHVSAFYDQLPYCLAMKADNFTNKHYWIGYTTINAQKLRSIVGLVAYKL